MLPQAYPFFKDLDISSLKNNIILLDIDGTLVFDNGLELDDITIQKVKELAQSNKVFLCSNSKDLKRDKKFQAILGVGSVSGVYKKPNRKIKDLALEKFNKLEDAKQGLNKSAPIVVIGDKSIIDGRFAKKIGAEFIKIRGLYSGRESIFVRVSYFVDRLYSICCK